MYIMQFYFKSNKYFLALNWRERLYYTSYILGIIHAIVSSFGAIYGFLYADG